MLILAHKGDRKLFFGQKRTNLWTKRIFFLISNLVADNLNYLNRRIYILLSKIREKAGTTEKQ